mmetsp:Transcript_64573/g.150171  ORF Transcript_64573/g.150171 Transcript_64573/m.150171 type:complete len:353 (-) Transcript_64573:76-1134(-)
MAWQGSLSVGIFLATCSCVPALKLLPQQDANSDQAQVMQQYEVAWLHAQTGLVYQSAPQRANLTGDNRLRAGVHFIRIGKTGSTSFGDKVVREFCDIHEVCLGSTHIDWNQATWNGHYPGPVVTILRDPVERSLSEFFWLRDADGQLGAKNFQWDFQNASWLRQVNGKNLTRALGEYIHGYEKNPSRNRQALYILGFRHRRNEQSSHAVAPPGEAYDWDAHPQQLVRRAMDKLENLTAFGITECWLPSMRAIARQLKWDPDAVEQFASTKHERYWRKAMVDLGKRRSEAVRGKSDYKRLVELVGRDVPNDTPWRDVIPKPYVDAIKKWSHVDMLLYEAAKKRFREKFNETCP